MKTVNGRTMTSLICEHLIKVGDISDMEARGMFKCRSLSRRICDLKSRGWVINAIRKVDSTGQRYVRYVLNEKQRTFANGALFSTAEPVAPTVSIPV